LSPRWSWPVSKLRLVVAIVHADRRLDGDSPHDAREGEEQQHLRLTPSPAPAGAYLHGVGESAPLEGLTVSLADRKLEEQAAEQAQVEIQVDERETHRNEDHARHSEDSPR